MKKNAQLGASELALGHRILLQVKEEEAVPVAPRSEA
jgi:hypothetical protein